jgi:hypothetical protein
VRIRVINRWQGLLCCVLVWALPANASVIVQLKVLEGDGAVYRAGTRAARGLTVLVTDETGKPVEHAAVSFRLPEEGASGVFSSGLRTEVVTTGPDGRATVWGMQWNKTAGPVEMRITAIKDQARAGIISTQYLSDTVAMTALTKAGGEGVFTASNKGHTKWILIAAIAGGAAAAGLAFGRSHGTPAGAATGPAGVMIGNPSINVGHP